jgi:hypothetical protein
MPNHFNLDLNLISKELRLILEFLKMGNGERIKERKCKLFKNIDWELFFKLVMHHRVYPTLYVKLKGLDDTLIPKRIIDRLYQEYKKNTFQMLYLSGEMEQLSRLFTKNQIRLLFLKGPVLAADLYGDTSLRTSKDLDMLISIKDLEKAEALLLNAGYQREGDQPVLNHWKWREHHISYIHSSKGIQLEIHWRLNPRPSKEPSYDDLWERKRKSSLTAYPVYFLGKEDLFLYLINHGARHGWFRLRWLIDIDKMVRNGMDIDKITFLFKKYQCCHVGGQALILASDLLNTPIGCKLKKWTVTNQSKNLASQAVFFIQMIESLEIVMSSKRYKRYLFSLKSRMQKMIYMLISFYPDAADVKTLSLPRSLHFFYFPLHPFLWIWRKAQKLTYKNL